MTTPDDRVILERVILPIALADGLEVFDFKVRYTRGTANIELLVDFPAGGVRMEDCVSFNQRVVSALEESGSYGESYTVSVASPGLDRPLKDLRDFKRVLGQELEVHYRDDSGVICCGQGVMKEVGQDSVILKQRTGDDVCIPVERIQRACVEI